MEPNATNAPAQDQSILSLSKDALADDTEITSEFTNEEWSDFVAAQPGATSAHLIEWREIISDAFGYQPLYRVARRGGRIRGILPAFLVNSIFFGRHIISVPFLNAGGICASDDAARSALIADTFDLLKRHRAKHVEMRCAYPPPDGIQAREHKVRIVLDLPQDPETLWMQFRSEIRNRTRRAQNAGLAVEFHSSDIDGFYRVFADNMRDLGIPAHPRRFFEAVLERFETGRFATAELAVVRAGDEAIGGATILRFRDAIEVPWISCSRRHFELCPNNILYWEIMRRTCEEGLRTFDFGRSSPDTGPATFKMRWGARKEQLYWHYALAEGEAMPGEVASANPKFRRASDLWKRTPRAITDFIGPRLIAHLPG